MKKLDLKKDLKAYYLPRAKKVELIEIPRFDFLMSGGAIEPGKEPGNSPQFEENMMALYGAAYTMKIMFKKRAADPVDYPVMALEGFWDARDGKFDLQDKDNWDYTLMILVPELVKADHFEEALAQLRKKKGDQPGFSRLRLEAFREGLCLQALQIGPYTTEPETLAKMHAFLEENGYQDLVGQGGGNTMRSICVTRAKQPQKNSRRYCATRL